MPQFLVGFGSVAYNPLVWVSIAVCGVALVLLVVLGDPEERQRTGPSVRWRSADWP